MASKDSIALFFISFISLSGIFAILAFSHENATVTGQVSFIESLVNWVIKPFTVSVEKPKTEIIQEQVLEQKEELQKKSSSELAIIGSWRPYTQEIMYDAGGNDHIKKPVTRRLTINSEGTWEFGSTGTWKIEQINEDDWNRWGMGSFGPTKKLVLDGWNNAVADGPIEEGTEGVDFIWVIYHSEKLSLGPATIQIKFGH
ncbi:hypothetical protein HZA97_04360 [Candidatus Woesearchaeota archaeon]|nr:hypothetical protein [Candidatus Woesearchaeota archaeon]